MRKKLVAFEIEHLETCKSRVHNRGVRLKTTSTAGIAESQVIAIYEGHPVRCRHLTREEIPYCGFGESSEQTSESSPDTQPAAAACERPAIKQLTWYCFDDMPVLINRPASYQAYHMNITYRDDEDREIWLGTDAIDSEYPISNINSSYNHPNIILLPCLDHELIDTCTDKKMRLKRSPSEREYCVVAVALEPITPGKELLLAYGNPEFRTNTGYFWGPDEYFYPFLSPKPVEIRFHDQGASASVTSKALPLQKKLAELKDVIRSATVQGMSHFRLYEALNLKYTNPVNGEKIWTYGDIQYLCELWDIEYFQGYHSLTYLSHCCDPDGKLDNNGVNYLFGFIDSRIPSAKAPAIRPESIEDVIRWLKSEAGRLKKQPETDALKEQTERLEDQCQQLESLKYRNLQEDPEKDAMSLLEKEKITAMIVDFFGEDGCHIEKVTETFPWEKISFHLLPHEYWPEMFRPANWNTGHIRSMPELRPRLRGNQETKAIISLSILACYRPDNPEYLQHLKHTVRRNLALGATPAEIKKRMNPEGLIPTKKSAGLYWCRIHDDYVIPHHPDIPENLWGSTDWAELAPEHWRVLGLDESASPLRAALETFYIRSGYDTARNVCTSMHYHLWEHVPHIKPYINLSST